MANGRVAGLLAATLAAGCYDGAEPAAGSSEDSSSGAAGPHEPPPRVDSGGESTGQDADDDAIPEIEVPTELPELAWPSRCHATQGVATTSAAPDGALWIAQDDGAWSVVDPLGRATRQDPGMVGDALHAWSRERAFLHRDGALFEVDAQWATPVLWPAASPAIETSCGDPTTDSNGFVFASGLHQRDGGQWWRWSAPMGDELDAVAWFATQAGGCIDRDGAAWLGTSDGRSWRVRADRIDRLSAIDGAAGAVLVEGIGIAALEGGTLVLGSPEQGWQRHRFAIGDVVAVAAGGGALWALAGGAIHRFAAGAWSRVGYAGDAVSLVADGGGVWALAEHEVCHLHEATPLVLTGVHHLQRVDVDEVELAIDAAAEATPVAWLDARPLVIETIDAGDDDGIGRWRVPMVIAERGWHELRLVWTADGGLHERTLLVERRGFAGLTWNDDIEPLFVEHCAGSECHGPDPDSSSRPDLSTEAAWLQRRAAILARVSVEADMPPVGARSETWGHDVALMIFEWLDAQPNGG